MAMDASTPEASPELPEIVPFKHSSSLDRPILLPTQVTFLTHLTNLMGENN